MLVELALNAQRKCPRGRDVHSQHGELCLNRRYRWLDGCTVVPEKERNASITLHSTVVLAAASDVT